MGAVDEQLPKAIAFAVQILFVMAGICAMILFVNPYLIVAMVAVAYLYEQIRVMYMKTSQDIKRLEGTSK